MKTYSEFTRFFLDIDTAERHKLLITRGQRRTQDFSRAFRIGYIKNVF